MCCSCSVFVQVLGVLLLFVCYSVCLVLYSKHLVVTYSDPDSQVHLTFPSSLESLRHCLHVLLGIQAVAPVQVLCLFSAAYIFKQSFSIPGSMFLNLLAGALFPISIAFPLVCCLSAAGASLCFVFSKHVFSRLFTHFLAKRIEFFRAQVEANTDSLIYFLLFVRIFPFTPNWFVNIACPVIGVPLGKFFLSVFLGLMPYNYTCVQSGAILATMQSVNDIWNQKTLIKLCSIALIMLIPIAAKRILSARLNVSPQGRTRQASITDSATPVEKLD